MIHNMLKYRNFAVPTTDSGVGAPIGHTVWCKSFRGPWVHKNLWPFSFAFLYWQTIWSRRKTI